MKFICSLALVFCFATPSYAVQAYTLGPTISTTTGRASQSLAGTFNLSASSRTISTPTIVLNGANGSISASSITASTITFSLISGTTGTFSLISDTSFRGPKPWIGAEAYGAVADGSRDVLSAGTDNRAAIQAAMNALPPTGGEIFFSSAGVYRVSGTLNTPANKLVKIRGVRQPNNNGDFGTNLFFSQVDGSRGLVINTSVNGAHFEISDIGFHGNPLTGDLVYISTGMDGYLSMRNVTCIYAGGSCVHLDSLAGAGSTTSNNLFDHVVFSRSRGYGLQLDGATSGTTVRDSVMQQNVLGNLAHTGNTSMGALLVSGGDYSHYGSTDSQSIDFTNVTAGIIQGVYIESPSISRTTDLIRVRGNAAAGGLSTGIEIIGNSLSNGQSGGVGRTIGIFESSGVVVSGNRFACGISSSPLRSDYASTNLDWLTNSYTSNCTVPEWHGNFGRVLWKDGGLTVGTTPTATSAWFRVYGPGTGAKTTMQIDGGTVGETALQINAFNSSGLANGVGIRAGTTASDTALLIEDAGGATAYQKIRGDGNVGFGTYNPASKIHISSPTANGGLIIDGTGAPSTGTITCWALGGKIGRCTTAPVGSGCSCTAF